MKTFIKWILNIILSAKILFIIVLILIVYSCEKENVPKIDFVFNANEIIYYPDKISITFEIKTKDDLENYTIKWYNPDTLIGAGPIKINITNDLMLDFEISDNENSVKRFQYEIKTDTIDSVRYDYRNNFIGTYFCNVNYSYKDSKRNYQDTLYVVKTGSFKMLNILTNNDIKNNYGGNKMTYINSKGYYSYPTGNFYGYHSWVSFSNDSIYYSMSGPLGFYYTYTFEGIKIKH